MLSHREISYLALQGKLGIEQQRGPSHAKKPTMPVRLASAGTRVLTLLCATYATSVASASGSIAPSVQSDGPNLVLVRPTRRRSYDATLRYRRAHARCRRRSAGARGPRAGVLTS